MFSFKAMVAVSLNPRFTPQWRPSTAARAAEGTSLAFGTIFAEAQRRYLESVAPYARRLIDQAGVPEVDSIEGLPPAIALQQQRGTPSTRSTVGTVTTLSSSLRLLYSRAGTTGSWFPGLFVFFFGTVNTGELHGRGQLHRPRWNTCAEVDVGVEAAGGVEARGPSAASGRDAASTAARAASAPPAARRRSTSGSAGAADPEGRGAFPGGAHAALRAVGVLLAAVLSGAASGEKDSGHRHDQGKQQVLHGGAPGVSSPQDTARARQSQHGRFFF